MAGIRQVEPMLRTIKDSLLAFVLTVFASLPQGALASENSIRVYAASSLTNVLNELISDYQSKHKIKIVPIYGGSSSLARQIEQGAPADLFISANERWVEHLAQKGIANPQFIHDFTHNQLVVVSASSRAVQLDVDQVTSWMEALNGGRLAVGQPNAVPAGIYAQQSLESLGVWSSLSQHLAPTNNVRIALTLVEREEAPLGIVYQSDALISNKVRVVHTFADKTHDPIRYPLVELTQSSDVAAFAEYLVSDQAKRVLTRFGFN